MAFWNMLSFIYVSVPLLLHYPNVPLSNYVPPFPLSGIILPTISLSIASSSFPIISFFFSRLLELLQVIYSKDWIYDLQMRKDMQSVFLGRGYSIEYTIQLIHLHENSWLYILCDWIGFHLYTCHIFIIHPSVGCLGCFHFRIAVGMAKQESLLLTSLDICQPVIQLDTFLA